MIARVITLKTKRTGKSKAPNQMFFNVDKDVRDHFGNKEQNIVVVFFDEGEELSTAKFEEAIRYAEKMKEISKDIAKLKKEMNFYDKPIKKNSC